jgi:hypothetical protein
MRIRALLLCFFGCCLFTLAFAGSLAAQEANSGFDLNSTISAEALYSPQLAIPERDNTQAVGAARAVFYPTWKLSKHWTLFGSVQAYSLPYFYEDFTTSGHLLHGNVMQANLSYSRFWANRSVIVRAGYLSSAFGSFLLRYDDAVNPLVDMPASYGYYYKFVTTTGLPGAEVDSTLGKFDARLQFTNSSPANPQPLTSRDQYGDWAGGAGYTIVQGLRVGASAYSGPYLSRNYAFFFPGESNPNLLPGSGVGADIEWGHGPLNVNGEWQRFQMDYHAIPTFIDQVGYGEARVTLHPRWYAATRLTYQRPNEGHPSQTYEFAVGYRVGAHELMKVDYEAQQGEGISGTSQNTLAVQFVTSLHMVSLAGR